MLEWFRQNASLISAFASVATLFVWVFYAQLLYYGYSRQRRPRVLINKGVGTADLDAPCLICNMSKEAIFIQGIFVDLETNEGSYSAPATDAEEGEVDPTQAKLGAITRQGPLDSGKCFEVRRFGDLLQRVATVAGLKLTDGLPDDPETTLRSLTITVVSIYGPEDDPFGAERKFELDCDEPGRVKIRPVSLDTTRLNSRQEKKRAKELLKRAF